MRRVSEIPEVASAADRAARIADRIKSASHTERIGRGVEAYGWSPDAKCSWCGDTGKTPLGAEYCQCPAGVAKRSADREAQLLAEWERRWKLTGVPRRFMSYRLDGSPLRDEATRHLVDEVRFWTASDPVESGENLLITGTVGTGKTGLAIGAMWELHSLGLSDLWFVSTVNLIDSMKPPTTDETVLDRAKRAQVLVLDDLGTTRGTDFEKDRIFALVNARYEAQLPTVVTTNVSIRDLEGNIGERSVSRLVESCVVVAIDGNDRRRS